MADNSSIADIGGQENAQDEMVLKMRPLFIEDCEDKIESIGRHLELIINVGDSESEHITAVMRHIHSLKGLGGTFGFPGITVIAHRLEDFVRDLGGIDQKDVHNMYMFIDQIRNLIERDVQPSSEEISKIMRALPARNSKKAGRACAQTGGVEEGALEVLSVMPNSLQQRLVECELCHHGFRVSHLSSSFQSIEIAAHTYPDLIVLSALVDELEGLELINIFRALRATQNTPIIILTSFDEKQFPVDSLPENVALLRKGKDFKKDIMECLVSLKMAHR